MLCYARLQTNYDIGERGREEREGRGERRERGGERGEREGGERRERGGRRRGVNRLQTRAEGQIERNIKLFNAKFYMLASFSVTSLTDEKHS